MPEYDSSWLEGYIPAEEYAQVKDLPESLQRQLYPDLYSLGPNFGLVEKLSNYLHAEFAAATNSQIFEKQRPFYDDFVSLIDAEPVKWTEFFTDALSQSVKYRRTPAGQEKPSFDSKRKFATDAHIIRLLNYTRRVAHPPKGVSLTGIRTQVGGGWVDATSIIYSILWALVGEGILDEGSPSEALRPYWEEQILVLMAVHINDRT